MRFYIVVITQYKVVKEQKFFFLNFGHVEFHLKNADTKLYIRVLRLSISVGRCT